ncbi:MAG TPA: hypothetical protein VFF52_02550 [Isosphaeraceae bacterium]|nr:hypothetical protein [Isosphaeraceae bacterium]
MEPTTLEPFVRTRRLADGVLLLLMVLAAFALGCQELYDPDVWWHVRAGQWIWEHRAVPTRDPFTFASADRPWVDLHWLFQVILAAAFAAGGVPGMILMASAACAAVLLVVVTARDRRWPSWVVAACWLPALVVMSTRFVPRPELVSLLGVALYLAVLLRTDGTPALAWVLPVIQVFWVNAHGLFVLGPIILGVYLIDRLAGSPRRHSAAHPEEPPWGKRGWGHIGGAAAAVGVACLANPYGLRGAIFPLELFAKITSWGGLYKSYISEILDLRELVQKQGLALSGNPYFRAECFLFWAVPLSFMVPAIWRAGRLAAGPAASLGASPARALAWFGAFVLAAAMVLACVLGFPGLGTPGWMLRLGRLAPIGLVVLGTLGGAGLVRSSRPGASLAALGGVAEALWIIGLRAYLLGPEPGPAAWLGVPGPGAPVLGAATAVLGVAAAGLALRAGARLFRMVLVAAFGYLALQAFRNISLFALVAGFVLACNLAEWAAELSAELPAGRRRPGAWPAAGLAARVALAALVGLGIFTIVSGRFFRATGEPRRFGLREAPLAYPHEAARFAGRPGLPDRALVYELGSAGVYVFHNAPARKPFLDGRLEVPRPATFETYVRLEHMLNEGRPGWAEAVRRMGDPLILLHHQADVGAEATLLADPDWRCLYYDAVASVFVTRGRRDLTAGFPSVNFAARHFQAHDPARRAVPPSPWGLAEARALIDLSSVLRYRSGDRWQLPLALLLLASDRLRQAIAVDPTAAGPWTSLATACWDMIPDLTVPPPGPSDPWDPATGLLPAQATFCCCRALELDAGEILALDLLSRAFQVRQMSDAERAVADRLHRARTAAVPDADADRERFPVEPEGERLPVGWDREGRAGLSRAVAGLLRQGRAEAAVRLFAEAEDRGIIPEWPTCDRIATTLLHLGRPADARRIWEHADHPPSPALRLARLATAALAALDYATAETTYRAALALDPDLGEAWFGLALLHTQRGERAETLADCREGLRRRLTLAQTAFLEGLQTLAAPPESDR